MIAPNVLQDITARMFDVFTTTGFRKYSLQEDSHQPMSRLHPDSLGHGTPGLCLFMLELYKHTGDNLVLAQLTRSLEALEKHRQTSRTNNYGWLNGRTGLSFLYWQLFLHTGNQQWLDRSIEITQQFLQADSRYLTLSVHNGLEQGTAGLLLYYLHLYDTIRQPWLLQHIEQCLSLLVGKTQLAGEGLYWNNTSRDNRHAGWLNGSAGIAFSLLELGKYFQHTALVSLAEKALGYEDQLLIRDGQGIPAISCSGQCRSVTCIGACAKPSAPAPWGSQLIRLYAWQQHEFAQYRDTCNGNELWPAHSLDPGADNSLLQGAAGWGLACREAWLLTGQRQYLDKAHQFAANVLASLPDKTTDHLHHHNLYHGIAGVGYFLLKLAERTPAPSLLLFHLPQEEKEVHDTRQTSLSIDHRTINEKIARNNFDHTIYLIREKDPEALRDILTTPTILTSSDYLHQIDKLKASEWSADELRTLQETAEREATVIRIRERSHGHVASDDIAFAESVQQFAELTDEEILRLTLRIAPDMHILRQDPPIDFTKPLEPAMLPVIFESYGHNSYYFRVNKFNNIEQGKLRLSRIFADHFETPAVVEEVVRSFPSYVLQQDETVVSLVMNHLQAPDRAACSDILAGMAIHYIRELFMIGVLTK